MPFSSRLLGAGKLLVLAGALLATFAVSAFLAARVAVRSQEVTVPELTGRSVNDASAALLDLGLALRVDENRRIHPSVPAGQIIQQDPPAGLRARRQRTVRVWLSDGPPGSIVPAVAGQTERAAQVRLEQDGFALGAVAEIRSNEYPVDVVVAQTPAPRTRGTDVALLVNRAARGATFVMPDLIGVNGDRAAEFLRARGFRVALVGDHPYPGVPAGIVIRQNPAGGFQIAPGDAIALEVSR